MKYENTGEFARRMDTEDPLQRFRSRFYIPPYDGGESIYLTGNSLGLQPKNAREYVLCELDDWARWGVEGHFEAHHPWVRYHELFPASLSKIVGCRENEVVVMNSLTVNLHLLMVSFYRPTPRRYKIICEAKAFPSDQYAFESQAEFHGFAAADAIVEVQPREGEHGLRTEDIVAVIKEHSDSVALVLFGGVNYYTGQYYDIGAITVAAQECGAYAGFDLAHAAGNVPLRLHDWNVDFACWCSYKYLNSGPGAVSGVFIHERHAVNRDLPRFAGWWGYDKDSRFKMAKGFIPIPTAEGWQCSNAPVLSMAAHRASLDLFDEAGFEALVEKSRLLSGYLHYLLGEINRRQGREVIEVITPASPWEHGCQVSMLIPERGRDIFAALSGKGVVADWRDPNVIRVAPVPLYNSFEDVWRFGEIIQTILQS